MKSQRARTTKPSRPTGNRDLSGAVYPGSFDPITFGHIDLIQRLSTHFKSLVVLVAQSNAKEYLFSAEERVDLIKKSLGSLPGVRVEVYEGLTVDYAQKAGLGVIIRGLRAVSDFEHEFAMANMNRRLNSKIETMIVFTSPQYSYVSSRMVKEVAVNGGALTDLVPAVVVKALQKKLQKNFN